MTRAGGYNLELQSAFLSKYINVYVLKISIREPGQRVTELPSVDGQGRALVGYHMELDDVELTHLLCHRVEHGSSAFIGVVDRCSKYSISGNPPSKCYVPDCLVTSGNISNTK